MGEPLLNANLTVADVLERWPQTLQVFLRHRMACVGCVMATFNTLADAARIYGVNLEQFMGELQQAVKGSPHPG